MVWLVRQVLSSRSKTNWGSITCIYILFVWGGWNVLFCWLLLLKKKKKIIIEKCIRQKSRLNPFEEQWEGKKKTDLRLYNQVTRQNGFIHWLNRRQKYVKSKFGSVCTHWTHGLGLLVKQKCWVIFYNTQ